MTTATSEKKTIAPPPDANGDFDSANRLLKRIRKQLAEQPAAQQRWIIDSLNLAYPAKAE